MEISLGTPHIVRDDELDVRLSLHDTKSEFSFYVYRSFRMDDTWLEFEFFPEPLDFECESGGWIPVYDCPCVLDSDTLTFRLSDELRELARGDSELVCRHQLTADEFIRLRDVLARLFSGKRGFQTS